MNKTEFMRKLESIDAKFANVSITENEYKIIEYVYNWHPSIDAVRGKEQIAYLYCEFGMSLINDMVNTATAAMEAEQEMMKAKEAYEIAVMNYNKLKQGTH